MNWDLPTAVRLESGEYGVHADYRDVLDVIAHLEAPDDSDEERTYIALRLFYRDFKSIPPADWAQAAERMLEFINCGRPDEPSSLPRPRQIDWEQDGLLIVADVNRVAGREIRELPFLHWWSFIAWFNGIGEGQLSAVVSIRDKLRRGKKLEKWEQQYYRENKAQVDLKPRYTREELDEQERLKRLLGE